MKLNHRLVQRTYNTCKALMSTTFIKMLEYDRIDLKESTLIKIYQQVKNVICVVVGILLIKILIIKNICVMVATICLQKQ